MGKSIEEHCKRVRKGLENIKYGEITVKVENGRRFGLQYGISQDGKLKLDLTDENMEESIGLKNIAERIKLHYGDDYYLRVVSGSGSGAIVEIRIPQQPFHWRDIGEDDVQHFNCG